MTVAQLVEVLNSPRDKLFVRLSALVSATNDNLPIESPTSPSLAKKLVQGLMNVLEQEISMADYGNIVTLLSTMSSSLENPAVGVALVACNLYAKLHTVLQSVSRSPRRLEVVREFLVLIERLSQESISKREIAKEFLGSITDFVTDPSLDVGVRRDAISTLLHFVTPGNGGNEARSDIMSNSEFTVLITRVSDSLLMLGDYEMQAMTIELLKRVVTPFKNERLALGRLLSPKNETLADKIAALKSSTLVGDTRQLLLELNQASSTPSVFSVQSNGAGVVIRSDDASRKWEPVGQFVGRPYVDFGHTSLTTWLASVEKPEQRMLIEIAYQNVKHAEVSHTTGMVRLQLDCDIEILHDLYDFNNSEERFVLIFPPRSVALHTIYSIFDSRIVSQQRVAVAATPSHGYSITKPLKSLKVSVVKQPLSLGRMAGSQSQASVSSTPPLANPDDTGAGVAPPPLSPSPEVQLTLAPARAKRSAATRNRVEPMQPSLKHDVFDPPDTPKVVPVTKKVKRAQDHVDKQEEAQVQASVKAKAPAKTQAAKTQSKPRAKAQGKAPDKDQDRVQHNVQDKSNGKNDELPKSRKMDAPAEKKPIQAEAEPARVVPISKPLSYADAIARHHRKERTQHAAVLDPNVSSADETDQEEMEAAGSLAARLLAPQALSFSSINKKPGSKRKALSPQPLSPALQQEKKRAKQSSTTKRTTMKATPEDDVTPFTPKRALDYREQDDSEFGTVLQTLQKVMDRKVSGKKQQLTHMMSEMRDTLQRNIQHFLSKQTQELQTIQRSEKRKLEAMESDTKAHASKLATFYEKVTTELAAFGAKTEELGTQISATRAELTKAQATHDKRQQTALAELVHKAENDISSMEQSTTKLLRTNDAQKAKLVRALLERLTDD
eukprot:TRINITY_DN12012_c0_g1_i1.p1 TRINITY_DN12012_c0_g1~~TRINITY_DN12012_c0_g1_i1.p1  ORF type:complete len:894 (-),score=165.74 TRINITY_DN12012_c0_g1_i1:16-2697(-)